MNRTFEHVGTVYPGCITEFCLCFAVPIIDQSYVEVQFFYYVWPSLLHIIEIQLNTSIQNRKLVVLMPITYLVPSW